jgi:hypothetical protein
MENLKTLNALYLAPLPGTTFICALSLMETSLNSQRLSVSMYVVDQRSSPSQKWRSHAHSLRFFLQDWDKAIEAGAIWDINYIPSVFITLPEKDRNSLVKGLSDSIYKAKITIIDADDVHAYNVSDDKTCKRKKLYVMQMIDVVHILSFSLGRRLPTSQTG